MDTGVVGELIPMVIMTGMFAMIFGIVYLSKRERMAMIERGMDPRSYKPRSAPYQTLKWGLLLIGAGLGLFISLVLVNTALSHLDEESKPGVFFALIGIFGGLGLVASFLIEKKDDKNGGER